MGINLPIIAVTDQHLKEDDGVEGVFKEAKISGEGRM